MPVAVATILVTMIALGARAQTAGESVTLRAPSGIDVYAAGRTVELLAPVDGDAVLAGQSVVVGGSVAEDVIAAGETVSVRAPVGDDARLAARHVSLQTHVGGHLVAAAQRITLDSTVTIGDWAWLAGQHLLVQGDIGGELRAAGETIRVAGTIGGNVELYGGSVHIEAGTTINGDVTVYSNEEPVVDESAKIAGQVVHLPSPAEASGDDTWRMPGRAFFGIAVLLALLAYYWLFPDFAQRVATTFTADSLKSLGLGVAAISAMPLVIIILLVSGIGFLLALPLLAIYLVLLLLGYLAALYTIADLVARRIDREVSRLTRVFLLLLAVIVVAFVTLIPLLGPLTVVMLWLIGTGALVVATYRLYAGTAQQPA